MHRNHDRYIVIGVLLVGLIAAAVTFFATAKTGTNLGVLSKLSLNEEPPSTLAPPKVEPSSPAPSNSSPAKPTPPATKKNQGSNSSSNSSSNSGTNNNNSNNNGNTTVPPPGTSYGSQHQYRNPFQGGACTSGDNSGRINGEIRTALTQGKDAYLIPAGTCPISGAINFPDGTSNFAIVGAGSGRTVFTSPNNRIGNAFELGFSHFSHNNWGLTDLQNRAIDNVTAGSSTVRLRAGQAALEPGWHIVWDEYGVVNRYNQFPIYNRAEIVEVKSYNANTRVATLDIAVGRDFNVNAKIGPVTGRLSHNITLKGITFDGTAPGGQHSTGALYASMIRNLSIIDVAVKKFQGPAIAVMLSRNTDVSGVHLSENAGSYGLGINKSRFTDVHDSYAAPSVSTAFIGHTGDQDTIFRRLTTPRVDADHGFDGKRKTIKEITGNYTHPDYPGEGMADLTCGNLAWRDGVDGCYIDGVNSIHEVFSGPNSRNVVVNNSKLHILRINDEDGIGPISTTIKNSEIRRKGTYNWVINLNWFHPDTLIGRLEIDNTKIINDDPNGNFVIRGTNHIGELIIKNSQVINNSNRGYEMIYLDTNRDSRLSITNTRFISSSSDKAVYLSGFLNPCATVANNTYQIVGNSPTQFINTNICP